MDLGQINPAIYNRCGVNYRAMGGKTRSVAKSLYKKYDRFAAKFIKKNPR